MEVSYETRRVSAKSDNKQQQLWGKEKCVDFSLSHRAVIKTDTIKADESEVGFQRYPSDEGWASHSLHRRTERKWNNDSQNKLFFEL